MDIIVILLLIALIAINVAIANVVVTIRDILVDVITRQDDLERKQRNVDL